MAATPHRPDPDPSHRRWPSGKEQRAPADPEASAAADDSVVGARRHRRSWTAFDRLSARERNVLIQVGVISVVAVGDRPAVVGRRSHRGRHDARPGGHRSLRETRRPQPVIDVQPPVVRVSATPGVCNVLGVTTLSARAFSDRAAACRAVASDAGLRGREGAGPGRGRRRCARRRPDLRLHRPVLDAAVPRSDDDGTGSALPRPGRPGGAAGPRGARRGGAARADHADRRGRRRRLPRKLHAQSLATGPGGCCVLASSVATENAATISYATVGIVFTVLTAPVASHAIARAARRRGAEAEPR